MIKHILIVKSDGGFLFSKCYSEGCRLENISAPDAHQLFKTIRNISTEKPSSKVKTIIFEKMKMLVEARSEICVFVEIPMEGLENRFRPTIIEIANQVNDVFLQRGEDAVISVIANIVETVVKDRTNVNDD
ncbi:MAG: hypothetical protein ACTSW4_01960 [Candidatus Ranarchaeia archaeon]